MSRRALLVFLLLSLVSLLSDLVYEGGRSISGPLLERLGASLLVAGSVSAGELLVLVGRVLGGLAPQRARSESAYWGVLLLGYLSNIAIPALALAGSWETALALYMLERLGKGLRAPVRDAIIAEVAGNMKKGMIFGIHELFDQVGAFIGPLTVFYVASRSGYEAALSILFVPAAMSIALVLLAWRLRPTSIERREIVEGSSGEVLWVSIIAGLAMASFLHWGTASYLIGESAPLMYAIAMAADAAVAPLLGAIYDRLGNKAVLLMPLLSLSSTAAIFSGNPLVFAVIWGLSMSSYEVLPRAAIASASRPGALGVSYSLLYLFMGLGWLAGNMAMIVFSWKVAFLFAILSAAVAINRGL